MPHFSVHPLFARLCVVSRVTIHRLANNAIQKKQLARTDSLFIPGETATHMYIVVYGRPEPELGRSWEGAYGLHISDYLILLGHIWTP